MSSAAVDRIRARVSELRSVAGDRATAGWRPVRDAAGRWGVQSLEGYWICEVPGLLGRDQDGAIVAGFLAAALDDLQLLLRELDREADRREELARSLREATAEVEGRRAALHRLLDQVRGALSDYDCTIWRRVENARQLLELVPPAPRAVGPLDG